LNELSSFESIPPTFQDEFKGRTHGSKTA